MASGDFQPEVNDLTGSRRDLLVIEGNEDVLRVAAVNPVAVLVEHVNVDEMSVGVDRPVRADAS